MAHSSLSQAVIKLLREAHRRNLQEQKFTHGTPLRNVLLSRRKFVRSAAIATGAAFSSISLSRLLPAWSRGRPPVIAVVGAGIAGLSAAYYLKKAGLKATVYEARSRVGGRIQSVTGALASGLVTDLGGSLINTDHRDMLTFVKTFRLKLFNRNTDAEQYPFPGVSYFLDDQLRPEADLAEKLRPIARQIAQDSDLLDRDYDRYAPQFDQKSVAQYLDQHADKIPEPFIRTLLENTIRTEYGVEPEASTALQLIFILPVVKGKKVDLLSYSDEVYTVEGGIAKIIDGLAAALAGQIRTRMPLETLESRDKGFRLTFKDKTVVNADYVVLAMPFTTLRRIELEVDLPKTLRRFIEEGDLGRNEKLLAGFSRKLWRNKNGFVKEVWTDLGFAEAWDDSQRQTRRKDGALNFFAGGKQVEELNSGSPQHIGRIWTKRLEKVVPKLSSVSTGQFLRTRWDQDLYTRGAYANFKPGQLTAFQNFFYVESKNPKNRQDVAIGNLVFAGEQLSDEFYGFMNGAAQTGRLAAQVVIRRITQSP
ncbi:MAG: NAD(P)/FAD-dependent oxidoreductase [Thermosynechococcaceae cyanobacterium]